MVKRREPLPPEPIALNPVVTHLVAYFAGVLSVVLVAAMVAA